MCFFFDSNSNLGSWTRPAHLSFLTCSDNTLEWIAPEEKTKPKPKENKPKPKSQFLDDSSESSESSEDESDVEEEEEDLGPKRTLRLNNLMFYDDFRTELIMDKSITHELIGATFYKDFGDGNVPFGTVVRI